MSDTYTKVFGQTFVHPWLSHLFVVLPQTATNLGNWGTAINQHQTLLIKIVFACGAYVV